jgi:hypothetical protein
MKCLKIIKRLYFNFILFFSFSLPFSFIYSVSGSWEWSAAGQLLYLIQVLVLLNKAIIHFPFLRALRMILQDLAAPIAAAHSFLLASPRDCCLPVQILSKVQSSFWGNLLFPHLSRLCLCLSCHSFASTD